MIKEPDWKDPVYLAKLIIICNVVSLDKNVKNDLPFYFEKHYNYVQDIFPQFIQKSQNIIKDEEESSHSLFQMLFHYFISENEKILSNITKICSIAQELKNPINSCDIFLRKICKYVSNLARIRNSAIEGNALEVDFGLVAQTMRGLFKLQEKYVNVGEDLISLLDLFKFFCLLLIPLQSFKSKHCEVFEFKQIINIITTVLNVSLEFIQTKEAVFELFSPMVKEISLICKEILANPKRLNDYNERRKLFQAYSNSLNLRVFEKLQIFLPLNFPKKMKISRVILIEPHENFDDYLIIDSKFIAKVEIVLETHNILQVNIVF